MNLPVPIGLATTLADILLDVVFLKGVVLAGIAIVAGMGMRRAPAAGRGAIWSAGSIGLVALFGTVVAWLWKQPITPVWNVTLAAFPQQLYQQKVPGVTLEGIEASIAAWMGLIWGAGSLFLLMRFAYALTRVYRLTRRSRPVEDPEFRKTIACLLQRCRRGRTVRGRTVRVRLTHELDVPITYGIWRPVILLPDSAAAWDTDMLGAVLRHETTHVTRYDYLTLIALEIGRALHWPNPLAWYLVRRARLDQERACDDAVIEGGVPPEVYARHLVTIAQGTLRPTTATLPMGRRTMLWERVRDVMRLNANRRPASRRMVWLGFIAMTVVAWQITVSNLWSCPNGAAHSPAGDVVAPTGSKA